MAKKKLAVPTPTINPSEIPYEERDVPLSDIIRNSAIAANYRPDPEGDELESIKLTLAQNGLDTPIELMQLDNGEIHQINGNGRYCGASALGWGSIRSRVFKAADVLTSGLTVMQFVTRKRARSDDHRSLSFGARVRSLRQLAAAEGEASGGNGIDKTIADQLRLSVQYVAMLRKVDKMLGAVRNDWEEASGMNKDLAQQFSVMTLEEGRKAFRAFLKDGAKPAKSAGDRPKTGKGAVAQSFKEEMKAHHPWTADLPWDVIPTSPAARKALTSWIEHFSKRYSVILSP